MDCIKSFTDRVANAALEFLDIHQYEQVDDVLRPNEKVKRHSRSPYKML